MAPRKDIGNVDAALEELGHMGRYTMVQFFMQILVQVAVGHHMLSIVFTGQKNPFRCPAQTVYNSSSIYQLENSSLINSSIINASQIIYDSVCHLATAAEQNGYSNYTCNAFNVEYQLPKNRFFVSEFDLVCDREYLAGLTQTLLTLGHAIGALAVPYFADNYGRKPVLLLVSFLWLGSALGLAFSVNYVMLAVFKNLVGIFLQGVAQTSITVMTEILTSKQRGYMFGCLAYICWTVGIILMVPVAYLLRDDSWRSLELAYCSYFAFIIFYIFFQDESIRWLAAQGYKDRVTAVLKRASRWNGANFDKVMAAFYKDSEMDMLQYDSGEQQTETCNEKISFDIPLKSQEIDKITNHEDEMFAENGICPDQNDIDEKLNLFSFFTNRRLRFYIVFSITAWFFNSLTYYALFLMSATFSGSVYLNYFLNSVVELPSAIFIYFYIDRIGRKGCFATFSFIAGTSLMGVAVTSAVSDQHSTVITVLAIIGKFGISGSFASIFTMTPELLPTTIRNTGLGLANMSACVGGMLAPFADLLMTKVVYAPGLIFGSSSLFLSAWSYFLPETANRQLPQSLKDMDNWSKDSKRRKNDSHKSNAKD